MKLLSLGKELGIKREMKALISAQLSNKFGYCPLCTVSTYDFAVYKALQLSNRANTSHHLLLLNSSNFSHHLSSLLSIKYFFKKMGQSRPLFLFIFVFSTSYNLNSNWKKRRWCAWDSNPGWQDGRRERIHWATAAPQIFIPANFFAVIYS